MSDEGSTMALTKPEALFPVLAGEAQAAELMEAIEANIGGGEVDVWSLDRIKVALGGGTRWELPTLEGSTSVEQFRGIILHIEEGRGFWDSLEIDGSPPDCSSRNCRTGWGHRWKDDDEGPHDCASCKWSQWGSKAEHDPSAVGSNAQACGRKDGIFVLLEGESLPKVVQAPTGSLKWCRKYMMRLASASVPKHAALTVFRLAKDKNKAGQPFSRIEFSIAKDASGKAVVLSPEMRARVKQYIQSLGLILQNGRGDDRSGNGQGEES